MRVWWLIVWRSMVAGVVLGAIVGAVLGIIIALFQIDPAPLILHRFAPTPSPDQVEAVPAAYGAASISGSSGTTLRVRPFNINGLEQTCGQTHN